jgi:hypothetical protein
VSLYVHGLRSPQDVCVGGDGRLFVLDWTNGLLLAVSLRANDAAADRDLAWNVREEKSKASSSRATAAAAAAEQEPVAPLPVTIVATEVLRPGSGLTRARAVAALPAAHLPAGCTAVLLVAEEKTSLRPCHIRHVMVRPPLPAQVPVSTATTATAAATSSAATSGAVASMSSEVVWRSFAECAAEAMVATEDGRLIVLERATAAVHIFDARDGRRLSRRSAQDLQAAGAAGGGGGAGASVGPGAMTRVVDPVGIDAIDGLIVVADYGGYTTRVFADVDA